MSYGDPHPAQPKDTYGFMPEPSDFKPYILKANSASWSPTGALRILRLGAIGMLQQEWSSSFGEREWRDVPIVEAETAPDPVDHHQV